MSDATVGAILAAVNRLETQLSGVQTVMNKEHGDILCDVRAARSATVLLTSTFAGVTASIQILNEMIVVLQATVDGLQTSDTSTEVASIEDTITQMNATIGNMNAILVAFDPVIISDLVAQVDELVDQIGDVPVNTSLWDYLQGVTNVAAADSDTVRTKVTGSVVGTDGSAICNALVEILSSDSTTVLGQTNTATDGSWTIVIDSGATYCLQITVVGYNPFTSTFTIPAGTTAYTVS